MARRKRLCMISTKAENEQQHNKAQKLDSIDQIEKKHTMVSYNWLMNIFYIKGPPKKVRGPTQKNELWNMNKNKIVVKFNKYGKPVGVEGNELTQFLGSVVRIAGNVGLHCEDWRKVDKEKKEDMYSIVKEKFAFHPAETSAIKKWVLSSMGKKLNTWRNLVKSRNYDPALSVEEIMERQTDSRVNPEQFQVLVNRWMKPEYQAICEQKRISRSKMEEPHITGTKSFARLAEEEATKNNGVHPTRGKLYQISRTRKDGSIVNDKAAQVVASLQVIANDSTNTQGIQEDDWTNDDLSKVKGPKKRGYIPDNFSPGQNNSTNGNLGNSDQTSFVADQNIDSWGVKRSKVITMLAAFDEVTIRW
ncbi:hypothetical protein Tco_1145752 [Tanacetum coccineum]